MIRDVLVIDQRRTLRPSNTRGLCDVMPTWVRQVVVRNEVGHLLVLQFPDRRGYPCRGAKT